MSAEHAKAFVDAALSHDFDAAIDRCADDVVFRSPVVFKPYVGRETIRPLLRVIGEVFEDFTYTDQIHDGDRSVLVFQTKVGDREVHGLDMLRFDDQGRIVEFTVMVRPLSAALRLAEVVGARLASAE